MTMFRQARSKVAEALLKLIRFYFTGRTVHWLSLLGGQPIYRAEGKVTSARIDYWPDRTVKGMTFFWHIPGRSMSDLKRFSLTSLKRDKMFGWAFFSD